MRFMMILGLLMIFGAGSEAANRVDSLQFAEFKRVKVPKPGEKNKIRVQIREIPSVKAKKDTRQTEGESAAPPSKGSYPWFWQALEKDATYSALPFSDLEALIAKNAAQASIGQPRLEELSQIATAYRAPILLASVKTGVSPALILAVIYVESRGKADAQSGAGAQGLMQLIPATAARFKVEDAFDAAQNIQAGATYLNWLLGEFGNDPVLALAGYNAGENAVKKENRVPDYTETRDYVPKVLAAWLVAKGLCLTPPGLVRDGCVFRLAQK
ncbi:MAG: lytic transglycosylase domain-containing protein [Halocynthiibacter sp.]